LTVIEPNGSVIPVDAIASETRSLWLLCSFQGPPEAYARPGGDGLATSARSPGGRRSLKAQQHAGHRRSRSRRRVTLAKISRPGSVDVLGPLVARPSRNGTLAPAGRRYGAP